MSTNTLIIIVVLILLFGGGGFYWRGRRGVGRPRPVRADCRPRWRRHGPALSLASRARAVLRRIR